MKQERNEGEIHAEYADDFVKTLPLRKVELRVTPESDLEDASKKMFYIGDFLKRFFGGRQLGPTVIEAERMCTKFTLWKNKRAKSLAASGRMDEAELIRSIEIPFVDLTIQSAYKFHEETFKKMSSLAMDYWEAFDQWVNLKEISEEAVLIWKERQKNSKVLPVSVFKDGDAKDTADVVKKLVDFSFMKYKVDHNTHKADKEISLRQIKDGYVNGFINAHFDEVHMPANREGVGIFRNEFPQFVHNMKSYVAKGAGPEVREALDGLNYDSVANLAERNISFLRQNGNNLTPSELSDFKNVRFWKIILEQVTIAQISGIH